MFLSFWISKLQNIKLSFSKIIINNSENQIPNSDFSKFQTPVLQMPNLKFSNFNISKYWICNCLEFQRWGPNLLLGRTSFLANLFLEAYCKKGTIVQDANTPWAPSGSKRIMRLVARTPPPLTMKLGFRCGCCRFEVCQMTFVTLRSCLATATKNGKHKISEIS